MKVYAIIPARSGSKGLPDKNIKKIAGKPLLAYSIDFAKKLTCVDKIICSTDSQSYAELAKEYGAEVPFLRSDYAARDSAMEQDILKDLREKFKENNIDEPDLVVWLRPTFVFRNVEHVTACVNILKNDNTFSSARTVVNTENRLYHIDEKNCLIPNFDDKSKSMIRRQDMPKSYKVFSTDIIRFKNNQFDDDFLGRNVHAVVTDVICGLDIDDYYDFVIVKNIIENAPEIVNEYL